MAKALHQNEMKLGLILSYLTLVLNYVISIVYTPIMLNMLGQNDYGLLNIVIALISYLGILNFGFNSTYIRYYSRLNSKNSIEKIANLNGLFLIIFVTLSILVIIIGYLISNNITLILGTSLTISELNRVKLLFLILVFNLSISFPNYIFSSYILIHERFVFQKMLELLRIVINPFIQIPFLFLGFGSLGIVIVTTILNIIFNFLNFYYCFSKLKIKFRFSDIDTSLYSEVSKYTFFIFLNMIIDQINWNIDKIIIGRQKGAISVAIYGIAAQINLYYISLSNTIASLFTPRIHRLVEKENSDIDFNVLINRIGRIQFILLFTILTGFIFFGKQFLHFWVGNEYNDSFYILIILMLPVTIPLIQNIGIEIQRAKNKHKFRTIIYLFIAVINIVSTIYLTKSYGAIGAALGTSIAVLIGNGLIMNLYNHFYVNLNMIKFWGNILKIVPSFLIPILFGIYVNISLNLYNFNTFILMGFIYIFLCFLSLWIFGLNMYEKGLIVSPIKNIWHRILIKMNL